MTAPLYARYVPPQAPPATVEQPPAKKRKKEADNKPLRDDDSRKHHTVLSKFEKSSQQQPKKQDATASLQSTEDPPQISSVLHDLTDFPQPPPAKDTPSQPTFTTLPTWLAAPHTVPSTASVPFRSLNISARIVQNLQNQDIKDTLAIQTTVLPLLLPGSAAHRGDVCVSASTGSGKTFAYIIPIIEALKASLTTSLRALVVVPTRELAVQVRDVAELCASGSSVSIGVATGSRALEEEQQHLVKKSQRYDPKAYAEHQREADEKLRDGTLEHDPKLREQIMALPEHVVFYESKVDLLICTPGRLVGHIQDTDGFSLDQLEWLVLDEADRLLDESFQQWLETLMNNLERKRSFAELTAREKVISVLRHEPPRRNIKKVILSATMTQNLDKLNSLKLRRPTLVTLEEARLTDTQTSLSDGKAVPNCMEGEVFSIPPGLKEWAIPVGDGNDKPLYLLALLQSKIHPLDMQQSHKSRTVAVSLIGGADDGDDPSTLIASDDFDESLRQGQESDKLSSSLAFTSSLEEDEDDEKQRSSAAGGHQSKSLASTESHDEGTGVLIFTKSNESATRLSRLLGLLHPPYAESVGIINKTSTKSEKRKILSAFSNGALPILIASDRVSRGLDIANLAHIVNYDMPRSLTAYIHRVGRTARADKKGQAWTLFTNVEARWFWNAIARAPEVLRGYRKVERVKIDVDQLDTVTEEKYAEALKELGDAVAAVKM